MTTFHDYTSNTGSWTGVSDRHYLTGEYHLNPIDQLSVLTRLIWDIGPVTGTWSMYVLNLQVFRDQSEHKEHDPAPYILLVYPGNG